jgi:ferredoxin--NADP+ reductase
VTPSSEKHYQVRVVSRRDLSPDLWVIRVERNSEFHFVAGQYATLGEPAKGKLIERAYSIVSSPYESELEFFIELVQQGQLTPHLHSRKPGDILTCRRIAKGRFTLDLKSGRTKHLLLATVTGIAPYVSYIRTLYADWKKGQMPGEHKLYVVHGASRSKEFGYREELGRVAAETTWLKYLPTVSRPWEETFWKGEVGRVDDVIRKYTDLWSLEPEKTSAYLCGHPNMVENGRGILHRRGWKKDAMAEEVYFLPAQEAAGR